MSFDHLRATYFEECAELLESAYAALAALAEGRADDDTLHALFRAIHSIKGGGGAFGFTRLVGLAHVMETLLDRLRDGSMKASPAQVALVLQGTDALADLLAAERAGQGAAPGFEDALVDAFAQALGDEAGAPAPKQAASSAPSGTGWVIRFRPHASLFRHANEPLLLVRALKRLGPVEATPELDHLPPLDRLEPEDAYLAWTFRLDAAVPLGQVEEVFEFVVDDCDLAIEPVVAAAPVAEQVTAAAEAMVEAPAATPRADQAPALQSVRVDVAKVDRLVNLVGELVINQAMLVQLGSALPPEICPGLITGLETLSQHLRELQEGVMAIRTQPVKSVFSRMPRLVRELSAQLGKEVRLVITGEATEIDKTVVEQLADARILATDIDTDMVATAAAGRYGMERLRGIPPAMRHAHTRRIDAQTVGMSTELKSLITFKPLNLLAPWPMRGSFDAIFCRNVVIYFDKPTQRVLFDRFAEMLRPDGHLFVGHSESLYRVSERFTHIGRTVYRRVR